MERWWDILISCLSNQNSGNLKPFKLNEPLNQSNIENGVTKLNSDNFNDTIKDPKNNVIVFFTKEDCKICDEFMKVYEQASIQLKGRSIPIYYHSNDDSNIF